MRSSGRDAGLMNRREAVGLLAGVAAGGAARMSWGARPAGPLKGRPAKSGLGLVFYACQQERLARRRAGTPPDLFEPLALRGSSIPR